MLILIYCLTNLIGFSGENSSRGFGGDRGFGRDRGNRGFGRDYGDRGFGGDRRDHEEGEFGGRKGFDGRNNGFGTRGRREGRCCEHHVLYYTMNITMYMYMYLGNEGSGFGSKFNDDQNEDERRGFRGGGGGFSGKGFSRRESSDSNGKYVLTILSCFITYTNVHVCYNKCTMIL